MLKAASPELAGTDLQSSCLPMLASMHCHAMISPLHSQQHDQHVQSSAYRGGPQTMTQLASNHVSLHFPTQKHWESKQNEMIK